MLRRPRMEEGYPEQSCCCCWWALTILDECAGEEEGGAEMHCGTEDRVGEVLRSAAEILLACSSQKRRGAGVPVPA